MRIFSVLVLLLATSLAARAAQAERPVGKNCDLTSPPVSAGEEMNHGTVLRIYPRAKDIDAKYTGCQVLLAPNSTSWVVVSLTDIVGGDPIRLWSAHEQDSTVHACRFSRGKVTQGNPDTCPAPEFLLLKSLAPGCVQIVRGVVAKGGLGAPWPPECQYE